MERKKYLLKIFLFLILSTVSLDLVSDNKSKIYQAFLSGNMSAWREVTEKMQKEYNEEEGFLLELINYQFGYIGWALGNGKKADGELYLQKLKSNLATLESKTGATSIVYFYKSIISSFSISLNKLKVAQLGMESLESAKKSLGIDPLNPFANIQYANCYYYMPAVFGGSKTKGLEYYTRALKRMETPGYIIEQDWNYLNLLVQIAQVYRDLRRYTEAEAMYKKIIKIEPDFIWVRDKLYPELLKKMKK